MLNAISGIQPSILRWARESQGLTIYDVAVHLKRGANEIEAWENGTLSPTYIQLETLAYKLYKRPVAIFFLPEPPFEIPLKKAFRTLPDIELDALSADIRYRLRLTRAFQLSLAELNDGINASVRKIFRDIPLSADLRRLAEQTERIRQYLGISLQTQASWHKDETALKVWRNAIENSGIFVFKQPLKQKGISGFCLLDDEFPVICINNSASKTRQIFSLFHELAHLLLKVNGISKYDESYINQLPQKEQGVERFCNRFSAELLIPSHDFDKRVGSVGAITIKLVEELSAHYSVSREAVMRRLLDEGRVTKEEYEKRAKEWAAQKVKPAKGDYFKNQATYLGEGYLQLVFGKHYQGKLTVEQVADYLGVKTKSIAGLESLVLGKAVTV
jgi:Zn-dependent peptidase ImmA (M78 family)/transcriptional regulator with XRE-family HTH domain